MYLVKYTSTISSAVIFLNTLNMQTKKTPWRLQWQDCIQSGSSELSQCYMRNMRETKSVQIISDKVVCLTKANSGCPEHGKNVIIFPGLLSQHPMAFTEVMFCILSPLKD